MVFKLANEQESSASLGLTKFQRREATKALATSQDGILGSHHSNYLDRFS